MGAREPTPRDMGGGFRRATQPSASVEIPSFRDLADSTRVSIENGAVSSGGSGG